MSAADGNGAGWLRPPEEKEGLRRYLETARERWPVVALAVALTMGLTVIYLLRSDPVYEAEATVLVTPLPNDSPLLVGPGLIKETNDPLRAVQTAAALAEAREVAERTSSLMPGTRDPDRILEDVEVEPVAESNLLAVTARAASARDAAALATSYARSIVAERTLSLHRRVTAQIAAVRSQGATVGGLAQLRLLRAAGDPTVQLESGATPPDGPAWPRPIPSLIGALLAGLVLGLGGAFAIGMLDPNLRREEQLRDRFRRPVLARIPRVRTDSSAPLGPDALTPGAMEGYRTLRASLAISRARAGGPRAVLVTSASQGEGKSTSAATLAATLALAGNQVILIESDVRRPTLGNTLGESARRGVVSVLIEEAALDDALVPSSMYGPNLQLLLAEQAGAWIADLFSIPAAVEMVRRAKELADYVIIDSPPMVEVVDALPLARLVDDVVVVTRLERTRLDRLNELAELLGDNGVTPAGFVLVGVADQPNGYYGEYQRPPVRARAPEPAIRPS